MSVLFARSAGPLPGLVLFLVPRRRQKLRVTFHCRNLQISEGERAAEEWIQVLRRRRKSIKDHDEEGQKWLPII